MSKKTFDAAETAGCALISQVKENQRDLLEEVRLAETLSAPVSSYRSVDKGHGRTETRRVKVYDAAETLDGNPGWSCRIACVARVDRETKVFNTRKRSWDKRMETAYYVGSRLFRAKLMAGMIRGHWGIENANNYVRDVTLGEDRSRIRKNPGILARLRSFALNIMRHEGVENVSHELYMNALNIGRILRYRGL